MTVLLIVAVLVLAMALAGLLMWALCVAAKIGDAQIVVDDDEPDV